MSAKKNHDCTIVVLGIHKDGRPRAAAYSSANRELAIKAADRWKLRMGYACDAAGLELLKEIPSGLQHHFEKVDAPVIRHDLYGMLQKTLKAEPAPGLSQPEASTTKSYNPWLAIAKGGTVLWQSDPSEGYFPCEVVGISKDNKMLTLKWIGYPKLPTFQAKRIAVGLIAVEK